MKESFLEEVTQKANKPPSFYFYLNDIIEPYFEDLAQFGNIESLPPVLFKIYNINKETYKNDYLNLKKQIFEILDNEQFLRWLPSTNRNC